MKIPCLCSIHAGSFFFPPRFQNSQNGSPISKVYPVNLALLQEIYEPETYEHLTADILFKEVTSVNAINMTVYENRYQHLMDSNKRAQLSLKSGVERAKKNQAIYKYLSDPIISGEWLPDSTSSEWTSGPTIISLVFLGLVVFSTIMLVILSYRFRILCLAHFSLGTHAVRVHDTLVLSGTSYKSTTSVPVSSSTNFLPSITLPSHDDPVYDHLLYVFIGVILSILVIKMLKSAKRPLCKTTIYIELTDGLRCRLIEIAKLSMCPKFLNLTGSRYVDRFCIKKRLLTSYLTFDWNDISLTNTLNGRQIKLRDKIKLGPIESWYVGNILKDTMHTLCTDTWELPATKLLLQFVKIRKFFMITINY